MPTLATSRSSTAHARSARDRVTRHSSTVTRRDLSRRLSRSEWLFSPSRFPDLTRRMLPRRHNVAPTTDLLNCVFSPNTAEVWKEGFLKNYPDLRYQQDAVCPRPADWRAHTGDGVFNCYCKSATPLPVRRGVQRLFGLVCVVWLLFTGQPLRSEPRCGPRFCHAHQAVCRGLRLRNAT